MWHVGSMVGSAMPGDKEIRLAPLFENSSSSKQLLQQSSFWQCPNLTTLVFSALKKHIRDELVDRTFGNAPTLS